MADTAVNITAGLGTAIDTRTEGTNGNHRQVVVIGDPASNAGVAPVDATTGLAVNVTNASLTVASHAVTNAGTFVTQENGALLTAAQLIDDTIVAQGTALGTTKNSLIGGSVTTAAPTYTTGQISPLSLDTSGALRVSGAGGGTQYTEDVAAATDPVGNMLIAVRKDTLSTSEVSADGDNIALKATNKGKLHVAAEMRFADTVADTGSGTGGSATQRIIIDSSQLDPVVAHDAADSGAPYKQGFKATTSLAGLTLVANADRFAGVDGAQIVRPHCNLEDIVSGVAAITDGSSTSVIASAGAGVKNYITSAIFSNSSATAVTVDLRDGAAGTVKATFPVPANVSGAVCNLPVPLPFSAATAVCADPSAAATTVTVTLIGFKSKV